MSTSRSIHQLSGRLGFATVLVPAIGLVAAIVVSFVYAYANVYIPLGGYISLFLVGGFAFIVGTVVAHAGKLAKCRSVRFMQAMGALVGLVGLYVSWGVFIYALFTKMGMKGIPGLGEVLASPSGIWQAVVMINAEGWYSIAGMTPSGIVLWIFWAIEAAVVVGGVALIAATGIVDEVFCEECQQWVEGGVHVDLTYPVDQALWNQACAGDIAVLEQLEATQQYPFVRVTPHGCESCDSTSGYHLSEINLKVDDNGNTEEDSDDATGKFATDPGEFRRIQALVKPVCDRGQAATAVPV